VPVTVKFDALPAGSSVTFRVSVLPTETGTLTNSVDVTADNDTNVANNHSVSTCSISAPNALVTSLDFIPKALAYNAANGQVYFLENLGARRTYTPFGVSGSLVWSVNPETLKLAGGAQTAIGLVGNDLLDSSPSGSVDVAGDAVLVPINPSSLESQTPVTIGRVLYDLAVSPADANLVFISDESGSRLYRNGAPLPNGLEYHARAEFSNDGTILYAVNQETCSLSTYNVSPDGLTLRQALGVIGCSDFKTAHGFLYLNSGAIVDATTGAKLTNSLSLSAPSFVLPRTNDVLDVVTRQNGIWSVRRLNSQTLQEIRRITLDEIDGSPVQIAAAGANRIAIRTSGFGLYLVNLDPGLLSGRITVGNNNSATLTFDTVPGQQYRVERLDNIGQGTWTPLGPNFVADGITHDENISLEQTRSAFFRLVQNP